MTKEPNSSCSCYLCAHPEIVDPTAWARAQIAAAIADYGWQVVSVIGGKKSPPWSYTVGLWQSYRLPELFVGGLEATMPVIGSITSAAAGGTVK